MSKRMVPISTRISQEDIEFISQLNIPGAHTPSDKLRHIINDAKKQNEGLGDYRAALEMLNEWLLPVINTLRQAELEQNQHSELLFRLSTWLPDVMAFLLASTHSQDKLTLHDMQVIESGLIERIFRLFESIMQLGTTEPAACYNKNIMQQRIKPILELAELIKQKQLKELNYERETN
ncbi:MAG: hypothetical protein OEZ58_03920 [Gammaproteobacteria bacterium]|nr:hypothetical protein [Gammaproteobacteria bacterium]MDH5728111.1 hypothetical protein [Gammaproteobacteria bacterium]